MADVRIERTRQRIRTAFIQLVVATGYEQVTVREITRQAGVGYKTFYRHYESKEMLLLTILEEWITDFRQTLQRTDAPQLPLQNTIAALRFTRDNADLFLALAASPASERLLYPLRQAGLSEGSFFIKEVDIPRELAVHHFAAAIDALIKWWLREEMPYSIADMAAYINLLVIKPLQQLQR